jgi:hypothetical protein
MGTGGCANTGSGAYGIFLRQPDLNPPETRQREHRVHGNASLATWLTRLALNAARDDLRRQRTRALLHGALQSFRSRREHLFEDVEYLDELQRGLLRLNTRRDDRNDWARAHVPATGHETTAKSTWR